MKNNPLVKKFGDQNHWVNWRYRVVEGRKTKIPYQVNGKMAASTNPEHWSTFEEARSASENVGIVFKPDQLLLGIDIDHVIENGKIVHEQKQIIQEFIMEASTYCELSPSKTGLHLYLALTEPLKLTENKKAPFELYTSGRYFTTTLEPYGEELDVRTVTPEEALELLAMLGYPWKIIEPKKEDRKDSKQYASMDENIVLERMLKAKNGKEIEKLLDGDISAYKNDASSADMALLSHLAFWSRKDAALMESIWMNSKLGQREKTQERADYRNRSIQNAISNCTEVYENKTEKAVEENSHIDFLYILNEKKNKVILRNTENICRILRRHENFSGRFHFDIFKNVYETFENGKWRLLEDNDAVNVQTEISILFPDFFGTVGKDMVYDSIIKVSKENSIDSALDYVSNVKWDGVNRLASWLSMTYGVPEDDYHRAVGSNWLKGLVKRVVQPGCKFDYVLVLEGQQGSKKSTSLSVLGSVLGHVETTMSTESKDFFMQFQGKTIIEFSEGETLSRTEVKRMKAIITTQVDKYRMPYERASQDYPRRCVFAMTTNQEEYLKDETGNRRWLPVRVVFEEANVEWLKSNLDQLFAEAYHRVKDLEETVYEFPKAATEAHQDARRVLDANTDLIIDWYWNELKPAQRNAGVTIYQVYRDAISGGYVNRIMDKYIEVKISEILKTTLKLVKKRTTIHGTQVVKWTPLVPEAELIPVDKF